MTYDRHVINTCAWILFSTEKKKLKNHQSVDQLIARKITNDLSVMTDYSLHTAAS